MKYKTLIIIALFALVGLFTTPDPTQARSTNFYPFPQITGPDTGDNAWFPTFNLTCNAFTGQVESPGDDQSDYGVESVQWRLVGVYDHNGTELFIPADDGIVGTWDYDFQSSNDDTSTIRSKAYALPTTLPVTTRVYAVFQHRMRFVGDPAYGNWQGDFKVGDNTYIDFFARPSDVNFNASDFELSCGQNLATQPTVNLTNNTGTTFVEGDSGTQTVNFTATLSAPSSTPITAIIAADGLADDPSDDFDPPVNLSVIEGTDFNLFSVTNQQEPDTLSFRLEYPFVGLSDTYDENALGIDLRPPILTELVFAPGETSKSFSVQINGDTDIESDDEVTVSVHLVTNARRGTNASTLFTILDDDNGFLSFPDYVADECLMTPSSSQQFDVPFYLDRTMNEFAPIWFTVTSFNGATATPFDDYVEIFEPDFGDYGPVPMAQINSGNTVGTIPVVIYEDGYSEPAETIVVDVGQPEFVIDDINNFDIFFLDYAGIITSNDNDLIVTIPANGPDTNLASVATVTEGNGGQSLALIPVTMTSMAIDEFSVQPRAVTFTYEVFIAAADTASAADVLLGTGQMTIPAGQTTANIQVPVYGDAFAEGDETFSVRIIDQDGACLQNTLAQVTITDDDTFVPAPNALTLGGALDAAPLNLTFGWTHQLAQGVTDTAGGSWYNLLINNGSADVFSEWYSADEVCTGAACAIPFVDGNGQPYVLDDTTHTWTITSWKDDVLLTSAPGEFTVNIGAPVAPTVSDVMINFGQPQVTWAVDAATEWYRLDIFDETDTAAYGQWFNQADICNEETCAVNTMTVVQDGNYDAVVTAYGPANFFSETGPIEGTAFSFSVENGSTDPVGAITVLNGQLGEPDVSLAQVAGVDWYRVVIVDDDPVTLLYDQWFAAGDICADAICVVDTNLYLQGGDYTVYMQTYGPLGWNLSDAAYVEQQAFSVIDTPPADLTQLNTLHPNTGQPTLTWLGDPNATWYEVWLGVTEGSQTRYYQWNPADDLNCLGGDTCTLNLPDTYLSNGNHSWFVRAYGPGGFNEWVGTTFDVAAPAATAPTLISPADTIIEPSPDFVFVPVNGATWYQLVVSGAGGEIVNMWSSVSDLGCGANCAFSPEGLVLPAGAYSWTLRAYTPAGVGPTTTQTFTVTTD